MQLNIIQIAIYVACALLLFVYRELSVRKTSKLPQVPMAFLIIYCLLKAAIPLFRSSELTSTAYSLNVAATIVIWMAVIRIAVYFVVDYFIRQKRGYVIPTITRDFALAILYVIAAMIVLKQTTDVNLGSLLTTSAILTAVIGFAMQDTLGNLFSGLALQVEHPYQIGDWVGFEGMQGRVVGITWKSTKILTGAEELIFVPNNTISKATLTNFSRPTTKHITNFEIGASYNDPPHKVKRAITEVILNHPKVLKEHNPLVIVSKYDNFSVVYKAYFATDDASTEGRTRAEILSDLWYRFRRDGISIPYPIQEEREVTSADLMAEAKMKRSGEEARIVEMLEAVDIFKPLSQEERKELASNISVLEYAAGEEIVRQGAEGGPMYIIKEGEISILVSHNGSEPAEIIRMKKGQFFGEISLLTGCKRTATAKTLTDTVCYEIEKSDMQSILARDPRVLEAISAVLAKRQAGLNELRNRQDTLPDVKEEEGQILSKIRSFFGF